MDDMADGPVPHKFSPGHLEASGRSRSRAAQKSARRGLEFVGLVYEYHGLGVGNDCRFRVRAWDLAFRGADFWWFEVEL